MRPKVLILGHTGKVGTAIRAALGPKYDVLGANSAVLDANDLAMVGAMVADTKPDVVVNCIAHLGEDACEREPDRAFRLNTLLPRLLADYSERQAFKLVHFSSDGVFSGRKRDFLGESDVPDPVNIYGLTKYMADVSILGGCERHFVFRISVQFGESDGKPQFLEKMIARVRGGDRHLRIADDIVSSPTYSADVATVVRAAIEGDISYGLYHVVDTGSASLYELVSAAFEMLGWRAEVEPVSHVEFPTAARKHPITPLRQEKLPPLRHWRAALAEYCGRVEYHYAA